MSSTPPDGGPRLKFIDFDARRDPKTERWCVKCQKDLKPGVMVRNVRLIMIGGGPYSLYPEDAARYDAGELTIPGRHEDMKTEKMGMNCARAHGLEWSSPETKG